MDCFVAFALRNDAFFIPATWKRPTDASSAPLLPRPACGERVGVRGNFHAFGLPRESPSPEAYGFDLSPQAGRGENTHTPAIPPRHPRELCVV
jgi:hypothetical protein